MPSHASKSNITNAVSSLGVNYPLSTIEDTIGRFLQSFNCMWRWLEQIYDHDNVVAEVTAARSVSDPHESSKIDVEDNSGVKTTNTLGEDVASSEKSPSLKSQKSLAMLTMLDDAVERTQCLNPRKIGIITYGRDSPQRNMDMSYNDDLSSTDKEPSTWSHEYGCSPDMMELLRSYSKAFFDFYYITDELVWFGVREESERFAFNLARMVYELIFGHTLFARVLRHTDSQLQREKNMPVDHHPIDVPFEVKRLVRPWVKQLGHFLSYFPQEQTDIKSLHRLHKVLLQKTSTTP